MKLFAFGFGYTTIRFIDRHAGRLTHVAGTVRGHHKCDALRQRGLDCYLFDAADQHADIASRVAQADAMIVSVPPSRGHDPVLDTFGSQIATSVARRIVYLSTIGVYGDHGGAWIDETTPTAASLERARARLDAEAGWHNVAGGRLSILRLAGIYGPGRNPFVRLRDGTARRIVKPGQVFNRIHVEDAAQAVMAALDHASGGTWNVCDDEPAPPQDVIAYAASLMSIAPPPLEDFANAEMTPMARSFYASNNRVANARLKTDLGVKLDFPNYRVALNAMWDSAESRAEAVT